MAPIKVGFIGLSSSPPGAAAGRWGSGAHLPYLINSPSNQYQIVALCNSSVSSAQRAIEVHKLDPAVVKAYGDPVSLADDDNVDMVVCCVNVETHYDLVKPALQRAKMVYCEWPLASNLSQMEELAELAESKGVRTAVGLQGRMGAYVPAIQNLLGDDGNGKIGKVFSTSMTIHAGLVGPVMPKDAAYLTRIETGGNLLTIPGIHSLDTLTATLGEIKSYDSLLANRRKKLTVVDSNGKVLDPAHQNTTHDHIFLHGVLENGVVFTFNQRGGPGFKDTPGLEWLIYGEKGEVRVTCPAPMIMMSGGIKIEVHDFASGEVREVDFAEALGNEDPATRLGLTAPADNIARIYDEFAKEVDGGDGKGTKTRKYLDFKQCLKWARFIDESYKDAGVS